MTAPHNLDAEAAFLGSVLLDTTVLAELDPLAPGDFFDERHAHIWSGIQRLYQAGQPIDYLTVNNELVKLGRENVVAPQYTAQLTERVATAIHAKAYAEIVQDLGKRRRLITAARQIAEAGGDMQVETADAIARAHDVFLQATSTDSLVGPQKLSDIAAEHWEAVENALKGDRRGIPLGFANTLDKAIGGLRPKQLLILAGRPGDGKTTYARQVALQVAMRGLPTALFSLETGREEHLACIPHLLTRVDEKLTYTMGEYQLLSGARERMRDIPFYIDDTSPLSVSVLKTKLVQLRAREPGLAMIFVDYLQLMEGAKQREENLDVTPITRGLKQLAMNTGLPIVALSAMNRGIETRGPDAEPMLSDLRWGGEADADIVVFVRRVRQSAVEGMRGARNRAMPARVFIKKNRNGPVDDRFDLTFLAAQKRFEENVNDIA